MITGKGWFDLWSIEHIAWWIFFASNLEVLWWKGRLWLAILFFVVVALGWELLEYFYLEPYRIYADVESLRNRLGDLLADIVGFCMGLYIARHV